MTKRSWKIPIRRPRPWSILTTYLQRADRIHRFLDQDIAGQRAPSVQVAENKTVRGEKPSGKCPRRQGAPVVNTQGSAR